MGGGMDILVCGRAPSSPGIGKVCFYAPGNRSCIIYIDNNYIYIYNYIYIMLLATVLAFDGFVVTYHIIMSCCIFNYYRHHCIMYCLGSFFFCYPCHRVISILFFAYDYCPYHHAVLVFSLFFYFSLILEVN